MNCERTSTLLSAYLDEALPARDAGRVAGHLARCAACRRELADLERSVAVLNGVSLRTPPVDLWERFQERLAAESERRVHPGGGTSDRGRAIRDRWFWFAALRPAPGLALAGLAVAMGVTAYLVAVGSGGSGGAILAQSLVTPAAVERVPPRPVGAGAPSALASRQGGEARELPPGQPGIGRAIFPPEAVPDRPVQIRPRPEFPIPVLAKRPAPIGTAPSAPKEQIADAHGLLQGASQLSTGNGVHTKTAPSAPGAEGGADFARNPTVGVAAALQAGIESTMGQEVASEVVLLAQALSRQSDPAAGATTTESRGDGS
jgi:hypothetical protein